MNDKIKEYRFDSGRAKEYFIEYLAYTIGPIDLKNLMEEGAVTIIDVRRKADYDISHIPNALSMPKDDISNNLDKLDKNIPTVVYCYNEQCHIGAKSCLILADYGYPCVLLEGGFKTWKEDFRFAST